MSACIEDRLLEMLALNELDDKAIPPIASHLDQCHHCRDILEKYKSFYNASHYEFKAITEGKISTFRDQMLPLENKYTLNLISWTSQFSDLQKEPATLAADVDFVKAETQYENLAVLSDTSGEMIARIMHEKVENKWRLHLISDKPDKYQDVLIRLLPFDQQYVTNEFGQVEVENLASEQMSKLKLEVSTPSAVFDLDTLIPNWEEIIGKGQIHIENQDQEHIEIEFLPSGSNYTLRINLDQISSQDGSQKLHAVAVKSKKQSWLANVESGVALFRNVDFEPGIQVKVFG